MPAPPAPLSFRQKYGAPIASFFLWTSLTFVTLEFFYTAMETEEVRERTSNEIEGLKKKLEEAKERKAAEDLEGHLRLSGTTKKELSSSRTWWQFFFGTSTPR
jgi:hypothetical protein